MEERKEWFDKINGWKAKWPLSDYEKSERAGMIKPQALIEELSNLTADRKDTTLIATGVGQHQMWAAQHFRWRHPRTLSPRVASAPWVSASRPPSAPRSPGPTPLSSISMAMPRSA